MLSVGCKHIDIAPSCLAAALLQISCPTNTHIEVSDGASLEMTSAEASTKLNNVKIWLRAGNFLCTVPFLDWTSVETEVPAEVPLLDWTTAVETEVRVSRRLRSEDSPRLASTKEHTLAPGGVTTAVA